MRPIASLKKQFDSYCLCHSVRGAAAIEDTGLVLGAGTLLMRMTRDGIGLPMLDLTRDEERMLALFATAFGHPVSADVLNHLEAASEYWRRGERALANIRLAFARLPRIESQLDAWRLYLAATLLDNEFSPRILMEELGFDQLPFDLTKYDPNQPRVPAGSGRESGRWTSGNGAAASVGGVALEAGTLAEGLFGTEASSAFLAGLAAFGSAVGAGAALGAIFVPAPNNVTSEGRVPGDPDLRYSLDSDEGVLRFLHQDTTGKEVAVIAHLGRDGIFFEVATGIPVARMVGGSLVFDAHSLASESEDTRASVNAGSEIDAEEPQLCPDPGPDAPHGASARAIAYQAQISALNNPQRPLPPGMAVSLVDPQTGRRVVFDDCRESDGTMIEAKGPGYANLLEYSFFSEGILPARWVKQANNQVDASGGREIDWYFADETAADFAQGVFRNYENLRTIKVKHVLAGQ